MTLILRWTKACKLCMLGRYSSLPNFQERRLLTKSQSQSSVHSKTDDSIGQQLSWNLLISHSFNEGSRCIPEPSVENLDSQDPYRKVRNEFSFFHTFVMNNGKRSDWNKQST